MATPFDQFGYVDAERAVGLAATVSRVPGLAVSPLLGTGKADSSPRPVGGVTGEVEVVRRLVDGDHWLGAVGWIGPRPGTSEDGYAETMAIIQQGFVSENALADVIDRHVAGVLGREPHWGFVVRRALKADEQPSEEEQRLIDEAEAIVTEWWDARKIHAWMQSLVRTLLFAKRAPARLYVPRGKLRAENRNGKTVRVIDADGVQGGIGFVWPEEPLPERACVVVDDDTKESVGIALTRVGRDVTGNNQGEQRAEIVYVNENGQTIIRQVAQGAAIGAEAAAAVLDFGGRLTMYEMDRARFVSPQMIQLQRALNLALTSLPRTLVTSGWLERIITNAQMPGKWDTDETTGQKRFTPAKHTTGAGSTTFLKGVPNVDESTGQTTFATPGVHFRDPSSVDPVVNALEAIYRAILREAKQEHVLMSQDVKASGKAREQARADFEMTLRKTTSEANPLGRWIIETALAMAEAFSGEPGRFTKSLRATFACVVDTGPVTSDERSANDASYSAGTLSREGAMSANGVADVDAEQAKIVGDPSALIATRVQQATAIAALVTAGASLEGAAEFVGLTADEAAELVPEFVEPVLGPDGKPIVAPAPGDPAGGAPPAAKKDTSPADSGAAGNGSGGAGA